tara:strand:- start:414 stop:593 length:180 start_codon:yes stop_codon:yes gene_type:complete
MDKNEIIKELQEENSLLKNELEITKSELKKYTKQDEEKKKPLSLLDDPDYASILIFIGG